MPLITYRTPTVLIQVRTGDKVRYDDGRTGVLQKIELTTNGGSDQTLVAVLTVKMKGSTITATSDKFTPVVGEQYLDN